jgi:GNAT superfamily N-acetyltransferase
MKITDIPQDTEPRVGDIIEIEQGEDCFEVRIIGITADGYLCEQDNVQGAVLLEGTALDHRDVADIMPLVEGLRDPKDNPCWKGYHPVGTKQKNGRTVPNCVPNAKESVEEAGPFSYGAKKPRRGSVADLAAKKRREQEKNRPPIEPKDQMVGTAKLTKDVSETSDYFRRREREEAIISGQKPARKKQPAQTSDYARRREQEKKAEKGVAEGSGNNITYKQQKGKNKFSVEMLVDGKSAGIFQYDANSGRTIVELDPEYRGQKLGQRLILKGIYTAAMMGLDYAEDESRTQAFDNAMDSLADSGYIVNDNEYWYVTDKGEQFLKQGVAEGVGGWSGPLYDPALQGNGKKQRYEMMFKNGQVKRFSAMNDNEARKIAAGHGAKSVIKMKGNVPGDKIAEQGVAEGSLNPKKIAKAQMMKMYGDGNITFSKTSNGGYFIQHEDDFGDTNSHQYDPQTGKVDFRGSISSTYYGEGVAEGGWDGTRGWEKRNPLGSDRLPQDPMDRIDRMQAQTHELKQRSIARLLKKHPEWERSDLELASLPELIQMLRDDVNEAEYQGRKVALGKPMAGDVKKSKVYVRKPNGKVVKVNFGDKDMKIKKSNPARRKSFRARHNCANPGPRWKARYWSCRAW